ncbi:MAG: hypothetical protein HN931_07285 [Desulfobacterales bacterium]|jgi:hypothetical protein|nr:hypothetical protein [Desulfobacterales bacterium]
MKKSIILLYIILITGKFILASNVDLFGDEAFYWQCAQRPDISYIDHPPLTAMLVRSGVELVGNTLLGVRFLFLICGMIFPFAVYALAKPLAGNRNAWLAAGATLVFPGTAHFGIVAIPDVPMLLFVVLSLLFFERATRDGSLKEWLLTGVFGAMGLLTHYRFILLPFGAFLYLILIPRGRLHLRHKGPWLTGIILIFSLIPTLINNLRTDFEPVNYYFAGRHGLGLSYDKFLNFIFEQVFITTPFFFITLLVVLVMLIQKSRKGNDRATLFFILSFTQLFVFFIASPFETTELTTLHWTISGYVILLPYLPETLRNFVIVRPSIFRKVITGLVPGIGGVVILMVMIELGTGFLKLGDLRLPFIGWSEVGEKARREFLPGMLKVNKGRPIIVADNYVLGANLAFFMHDLSDIYIFDHAKNRMHGRSYQYRIWNRDEQGLLLNTGRNVLLIMERTANGRYESWQFQRNFCSLFESIEYLDELRILNSRKRFVFLFGYNLLADNIQPADLYGTRSCKLDIISCLELPVAGSSISGKVKVNGWAFKDDTGIFSVEVMIDNMKAGVAKYGISRGDVQKVFKGSSDPNHPNTGFTFNWDSRRINPGKHLIAIKVNTLDGKQSILHEREIIVVPSENN